MNEEPECLYPDDATPPGRESQDSLLLGLQLCRANTMSLTRLQLALRSGNRRSALEAIDRLHALDARIEHLIERLPAPANEGGDWQAIAKHLEDQKIAIAFEKLALASEISGPDMISNTRDSNAFEAEERTAPWPLELAPQPPRRLFDARLMIGVLIALLAVVALSSIAIVVSAL
ncbi:MAG TPA: hypothetical protein VJQ77_02625 [Novosphingobium sp.]|nr:hypothetical protein [Novosphingobium sp.]